MKFNSIIDPLKYENKIKIENVPTEWISMIQLFDPHLPLFPLIYIHFIHKDKERLYGFPVQFNFDQQYGKNILTFYFLSNVNLDSNSELKNRVKEELENRIGLRNKIGKEDLLSCCNGNEKYENLIRKLWDYTERAAGPYLPYIVLDKVYSIIRFTASLTSLSGRKSEMQMLYDFFSYYGQKVPMPIDGKWKNMLFYILPTYDEIRTKKMNAFPKFNQLVDAINKIRDIYYTESKDLNGKSLLIFDKKRGKNGKFRWQMSGKDWRDFTSDLHNDGFISEIEKSRLDFLLDAFNRFPIRAITFISTIININDKNDFNCWTKKDILDLHKINNKNLSVKVLSCILQQGFKNIEIVPVDTWIRSFYTCIFKIDHDKNDQNFITTFSNSGILERMIWFLSQGRKTNLEIFFNIMWCIKSGIDENRYNIDETKIRGPNPLSCFICDLKEFCPGYNGIKDKPVHIEEKETPDRKYDECEFIVQTESAVPKYVYISNSSKKNSKNNFMCDIPMDEYSGFMIHKNKTRKIGETISVDEFIKDLDDFKRD